jgi:hypothetical protein
MDIMNRCSISRNNTEQVLQSQITDLQSNIVVSGTNVAVGPNALNYLSTGTNNAAIGNAAGGGQYGITTGTILEFDLGGNVLPTAGTYRQWLLLTLPLPLSMPLISFGSQTQLYQAQRPLPQIPSITLSHGLVLHMVTQPTWTPPLECGYAQQQDFGSLPSLFCESYSGYPAWVFFHNGTAVSGRA